MGWTLSDIRQKVRQVTGRLFPEDLSTTMIDKYINDYYLYTFPSELKLNYKLTYYEFLTVENTASYDIPTGYTNFVPPATVDNQAIFWYQNQGVFNNLNPNQYQKSVQWTGDGTTTIFSTTVQQFPILPGTLYATDDEEVFEDTNTTWSNTTVNLVGSLGGTGNVNYLTGVVNLSFNTAPSNGAQIWLSYVQFVAGTPQAILYYNNQFTFYPVPNTAYKISMGAYQMVSPLINATDTPDLQEWGPMIAYGAAKQLVADYGEMDAFQELSALYKEQMIYVTRRTNQDLLNTRVLPQF